MDTNVVSTSSNLPFYIGFAIFILLVVFTIVAITGYYLSNQPMNTAALATNKGLFLAPCTNISACSSGLVCDGTTFVCKFGGGTVCSDGSDCATGLICSGLCASGATGGLNQLCPCGTGFVCTAQPSGLTVCKGTGGTSCKINSDCASGDCLSTGVCASGAQNAAPCVTNPQCASNNCSNGFCQNSGVITGILGAACAAPCVTFAGAGCSGTIAQPLTCECSNGTGLAGICAVATQGINSGCSTSLLCTDELVCFDSSAHNCTAGETGCICGFPYQDPNVITPGMVCIGGMSTARNLETCFNNNGFGCDIGGQCASSSCGGPSVLAFYRFSTSTIPNLLTNYVGATTTTMLRTAGPTGTIQPHKMLSVSSGVVDTIYVIDAIQGLLSLVFNSTTSTVITPWTVLIPHTTTTITGTGTSAITSTKTLLDMGFNGTTFIVAFDEMVTGSVTGHNDTVYSGTNLTALTPFNVQSGSGITGTQYSITGTPLSIDFIDISPANDVSSGNDALISFNGTINIKPAAQPFYSIGVIQGGSMNGKPMTGLTGPARFYFDNTENRGATGPPICPSTTPGSNNPISCPSVFNVAFVGPFAAFGSGTYEQVLQFSGNIAGVAQPIDRFQNTSLFVQYNVFDFSIFSPNPGGMPQSATIMLTQAFDNDTGVFIDNVVAASQGGATAPLAYRMSPTSRSVATRNALYVLSIGSCA